MSKLPEEIVVIVPCYNAGHRVRPVVEDVLTRVAKVYVIDDGSTDGCIDTLDGLGAEIIRLDVNQGKGHAMMAGYARALEDEAVQCVAVLDADGQHDPAELAGLYETFMSEEADMVIGSREFDGKDVPWRSRFGNKVTIAVVGWLLGQPIADTQSGYRLCSRRYLEEILPKLSGGRYEMEMEMLARAVVGGYRVTGAPIRTIYETGNPSSHFNKFRDSWQIYRTLFRATREARKG